MTLALNTEQLRAYLRELDEEYRRNRLAAETLLRSIERQEAGAAAAPVRPIVAKGDGAIIALVEQLVAASPEQTWDVHSVIATLERQKLTPSSNDLNKTIGNCLGKLYRQRKLDLVRKGRGSNPSQYRWKLGATITDSLSAGTFWEKPQ